MRVDIFTGDSDPVYWAVAAAYRNISPEWATRFSVAMLAYYHMGTALQAAELEGDAFWSFLSNIYPTAPRGSERRHFRGEAGIRGLRSMREWSNDPDYFFKRFVTNSYAQVRHVCESELSGFGPYFQLKICDYMDRCLQIPIINYRGLGQNLPTEPAKALALIGLGTWDNLCEQVQGWKIPAAPDFMRYAGPAEVETSLCGWKTTKFKGNWFGADIADKREALGSGIRADQMRSWMPPLVKRGTFTCEF